MTTPNPPLFPDELVSTGGERAVLETFLELHRDSVVRKVGGVSDVDGWRRLVPSLTTLAGLVKHLRWVEQEWFGMVLAERADLPPLPWTVSGSDAEFRQEPGDTVARLVADYEAECRRSREYAAGFELDYAVPHRRLGQVSLRWIYVHMIEETARHAGHADILRELVDGQTGL